MTAYSGVFLDSGLSADDAKRRYRLRRDALLSRLECPALIVGPFWEPCSESYWAAPSFSVYQDPYLLYLTGINQLNTALFLDPQTQETILYLPPKNEHHEFWEGVQLGGGSPEKDRVVLEVTGLSTIRPYQNLFLDLVTRFKTGSSDLGLVWYDAPKGRKKIPGYHDVFNQKLQRRFRSQGLSVSFRCLSDFQWDTRLCLDACDISHLKTANRLSLEAFDALCEALPYLKSETEVAGFLNGELQKRSWMGLSFPTIVAGGANAQVLHYRKNNDPLPPNGLLLLDFGCRYQGMPADISRTIPVSGTYNPLQKLLISIVLEAQSQVEGALRAGVSIDALNQLCWDFIQTQLDIHIRRKKGMIRLPYDKMPHGVSHLLGFAVHDGDPYRSYKSRPLLPGMVISNEPGIYGFFDVTLDGKRYVEEIGIRIEDNLLVLSEGCENLTRSF